MTARRNASIAPFYVMEVAKEAALLEAAGRHVIHLSIGEPDFIAPSVVQEAAITAIRSGKTQYTPALGLPALREQIAQHYAGTQHIQVDPANVIVTAGASAALLLSFAALLEREGSVLMPDPCYPCNRHFAAVLEGRAQLIPSGPEARYQLTAAQVAQHWGPQTLGVLLASPSNPTGTSIGEDELQRIAAVVRDRHGFLVVDEIYQGLSYDREASSVLRHCRDAVVINSFSKYFNMTGWRLGWLVAPPTLVPALEKLAQNLFICPSAISQQAALACFRPEALQIYEQRRLEFKRRRDYIVPALRDLGFSIPVMPDGAFYVYADISQLAPDSWDFAFDVLHATGVCIVPGRDFGHADPQRYVRISYATSLENLREAIQRLRTFLATRR